MTDRRDVPLLPAACSLDTSSGPERITRWRVLLYRAAISRRRTPGQLRICFVPDAEVRTELADLVEAERSCCGFLSWSTEEHADRLDLLVTGRAEDLDALPLR